jgi:hypothetical protein
MNVLNNVGHKLQSVAKYCGVSLVATTMLVACGGGSSSDSSGGSGGGGGTTTAVTLSGQVYDREIANADVTVYVGDTAVATTTTDQNGNYSVDLQVTEAARSSRCVVRATRDAVSLRSLLGNVGTIADTATANGGNVNNQVLPTANVTNVSTAVVAVIENSGGSLPDSQADIDAALDAIAADSTLQGNVVTIAAAVKAVVDYNGDPSVVGTATNTEELAQALAASTNLSADADTVVASSDATSTADLEQEVSGDPTLAEQIPSDEVELVAGLVGNTYVTSNTLGEETLLYFSDASNVTIASYSDIENGGIAGTYTDNADGSFTVNFTDPQDGDLTVKLTVTGGSANAINTNVVATGPDGTSDEGPHTLRRIIPVTASTSDADHMSIADLAGVNVIDVDNSTAVSISACDGTADNIALLSAQGTLSGSCDIALGMMVLTPVTNTVGAEKTMHGLMANSWNGQTISQQMSGVTWEADTNLGSVASYGRVYQPIDNAAPASAVSLRLYPDSGDGTVGSQLRMIAVDDNAGDNLAEGKMDLYMYMNSSDGVKTKDLIIETTHSETGSLVVNGSINTGQIDNSTTFWGSSNHGSVSIGVNLGQNANGFLGAVLLPNKAGGTGTIRTRYIYPLSEIVSADVSGKTFVITGLVTTDTETVTFNADGTGTIVGSGGSENFTWEIAAAVPSNEITSGVANYGTTLKLTWPQSGEVEYVFASKTGGSMIVGTYVVDSNGGFAGHSAVILTEQ